MLEIFRLTEAGETPDRALLLRLQEQTERVRRYEFRTIGKLPTSGRHNGELTHPISLTNLMAEILADAGKPLTDRQVDRIEALGVAFDRDFERLRGSYAGDEVRSKKILDEYQLKGRFVDDLHDLLAPAQRELVIDDTTYRVAGLDLYCPTLLILHTTPVVTGATVDEIESKLIQILQAKVNASTEALRPFVEEFLRGTRSLVDDPVPAHLARHYSFDEGLLAGQSTVTLHRALLRSLPIAEEQRDALVDDYAFYVPRLIEAPGS